jgi:molybdopterin converting factor small subunit
MVRVKLPGHLQTMAGVSGDVELEVGGRVSPQSILDALEARYPQLRGTIRDHGSQERRAYLRYFACKEDLSHEPPDKPLPDAVATGEEPFWVIGAIAGG